jgi:hypothetical protein
MNLSDLFNEPAQARFTRAHTTPRCPECDYFLCEACEHQWGHA